MNKSETYNSVTNNISVTVVATYEPEHSRIDRKHYVFSYEVTIMNLSEHSVQLLSREWYIKDLLDGVHQVVGDGVIGQQPIIEPGETFIYSSWSPITSTIGFMKGSYTFKDLVLDQEFKVEVPQFELFAGFQKN